MPLFPFLFLHTFSINHHVTVDAEASLDKSSIAVAASAVGAPSPNRVFSATFLLAGDFLGNAFSINLHESLLAVTAGDADSWAAVDVVATHVLTGGSALQVFTVLGALADFAFLGLRADSVDSDESLLAEAAPVVLLVTEDFLVATPLLAHLALRPFLVVAAFLRGALLPWDTLAVHTSHQRILAVAAGNTFFPHQFALTGVASLLAPQVALSVDLPLGAFGSVHWSS